MLLFSINRSRGYENPSLDIIVTERYSIGGCPLEEACEHCYLIQVLFLFKCYFYVLWRLCWIFYCYSSISSISFWFCIFYISSILHSLPIMGIPRLIQWWLERIITRGIVSLSGDMSLSIRTPNRIGYMQDTRYIKYAEQKRNARNDRITVKYPA